MGLSEEHFVHLPYDASLTRAGVVYASRSLQTPHSRMHRPTSHSLQSLVAEIAITLAFQRWLERQHVPFELLPATPFTAPDRRSLLLGGRRLELVPIRIHDHQRIHSIQNNPSLLLEVEMGLPRERLCTTNPTLHDLLVFAMLMELENQKQEDRRRDANVVPPAPLIAVPPDDPWRSLSGRSRLGHLTLEYEGVDALEISLCGCCSAHRDLTHTVRIRRGHAGNLPFDFTTVHYLQTARLPLGSVKLHSEGYRRPWRIRIEDWINPWVEGVEIILAGWLTRSAFKREAESLQPEQPARRPPRSRVEALSVPVRRLRPMHNLVERTLQG